MQIHSDRADIAITSRDTGLRRLIEYGLQDSGIKVLRPPLLELRLYPYMNIKHKELSKKLAKTLKKMKEDGTIQKLTEGLEEKY